MHAALVPAMRRQVCLACRVVQQKQAAAPLASTSTLSASRTFTTSSRTAAKLVEHKLDKDDPLDMQYLEDFRFDDIPWMGHLALEKDRERLHLLRLIEFQLPKIHGALKHINVILYVISTLTISIYVRPSTELRVPYQPPKGSDIIKLRTVYTLGQPDHPGSRKAVITLSIKDLVSKGDKLLQSKQSQHKFKLLAGQRWDPKDDSLKISCDDFPTFNMNAKWCSDVLDSLIAEARVGDLSFLVRTAPRRTLITASVTLITGHKRHHGGYSSRHSTCRRSRRKEESSESYNS